MDTEKNTPNEQVQLSRLIAGFWRQQHWDMSPQQLMGFVENLVERGITSMDHAMVYNSETAFGQALKLQPALRENLQLISKCGIRPTWSDELGAKEVNHYDSSAATIITSTEASLKNLGTDRLDLLLLHRPDYLMNVEEVVKAFIELKQAGKVLHFGVSNFSVSQVELLQSALDFPLQTNQFECSPYALEALDNGLLDQCQRLKMKPMFWSCLGGGSLFKADNKITKRLLPVLKVIAEQCGAASMAEVIYAWLLKLPCQGHLVIGSGKLQNIDALLPALDLQLSHEQWYTILQAAKGESVK